MSYEKELFNEVIYVAAGKLSPNDAADLLEWVESLEFAKRKVDEYEAKAKAFEKVAGIAYWYFERVNPEYADFSDYEGFYDDIKDEFKKLESGEYDAKK